VGVGSNTARRRRHGSSRYGSIRLLRNMPRVASSDDTAAEYVNEPTGSHTHGARGGLVPIRGVPLVAIRGRIVAIVNIPG
jgi:hypothetical protein